MLLLEDVQKEPLKVMNDASKSLTRSQVDDEFVSSRITLVHGSVRISFSFLDLSARSS